MKKLLFLLPFLTFLDLFIKYLAVNFLPSEGIYLFQDWLGLELFYNKNIAFGIPVPTPLLFFVNSLIILGIFYVLFKNFAGKEKLFFYRNLAIIFLLSGAIANMIDRLYNGFVVDYLVFAKFPVFNLADIFVVAGTFSWLILEYISDKNCSRSSMDRTIPS